MSLAADEEFSATLAAIQPELLARMNDGFEDAVVFVARVLGGHSEARTARITEIDRHGVTVAVDLAAGERLGRIDFAAPIDSPFELQDALFGLITRARSESGEGGTTSAEREAAEMSAIGTFLAEVVSVTDVHPHLREIVVGGDDLGRFTTTAPDTFVYVLLPPLGRTGLTIDQSFTWDA